MDDGLAGAAGLEGLCSVALLVCGICRQLPAAHEADLGPLGGDRWGASEGLVIAVIGSFNEAGGF